MGNVRSVPSFFFPSRASSRRVDYRNRYNDFLTNTAAEFARRTFLTRVRIDKKKFSFFYFFLLRDSRDFSHEFYGLDSIETRLSRDYKVTSTFLTGMFAINFRVTKMCVCVCVCECVCVCVCTRARAHVYVSFFFYS